MHKNFPKNPQKVAVSRSDMVVPAQPTAEDLPIFFDELYD